MKQRAALGARRAALLLLSLLLCLLLCACSQPSLDASLRRITRGQRFSIARWELQQLLSRQTAPEADLALPADEADRVRLYFDTVAQRNAAERRLERAIANGAQDDETAPLRAQRDALSARVEALRPHAQRILARQVREAYRSQGIYNPLDRLLPLPISFPPLAFTLEPLPNLLIVSPRDHIESTREILLDPELTVEQMQAIEAQVEALGYSALVERIGGLGATYPAFVAQSADLHWTASTVAEEWLHQYWAFTPLGWRYLLDLLQLRPDYDIARLNESAATIVQQEIGQLVVATYYPERLPAPPAASGDAAPAEPQPEAFSFEAEMRITRLQVDALLEADKITEAEAYMEARRQLFVARGYALRKLNQAYFAFHGSYAVPPADEELPPELVDPLGARLQALRARCGSLSCFVNTVAGFRSLQDLDAALAN